MTLSFNVFLTTLSFNVGVFDIVDWVQGKACSLESTTVAVSKDFLRHSDDSLVSWRNPWTDFGDTWNI